MQPNLCTLSLASLLLAAAPRLATSDPAPSTIAQDLERQARDAVGGAVEKKAQELADRLRGRPTEGSGARPVTGQGDDDDEEEYEGSDDLESSVAGDPMLQRLAAIEERLCAIEALLADLSSRCAPLAHGAAPIATHGAISPPTVAGVAPSASAPVPAIGGPVTAGFVKARLRSWHHSKHATLKVSINGLPAGRFDTDTTLDLAPFLQPGRSNQLAFSVEPRGKEDPTGIDVYLDGQMPGAEDYTAILQFQATKERLADTFDLPWAPR